jgi:hypothetical protein
MRTNHGYIPGKESINVLHLGGHVTLKSFEGNIGATPRHTGYDEE